MIKNELYNQLLGKVQQAGGEKCFVVKYFELNGCRCEQYDDDNFFATVKSKDGTYKVVEAKSLDEMRNKIK